MPLGRPPHRYGARNQWSAHSGAPSSAPGSSSDSSLTIPALTLHMRPFAGLDRSSPRAHAAPTASRSVDPQT